MNLKFWKKKSENIVEKPQIMRFQMMFEGFDNRKDICKSPHKENDMPFEVCCLRTKTHAGPHWWMGITWN